MKQKIKNFLSIPGIKYLIPSLLTVLIYYFSNNTAGVVLFQVWSVAISVGVLFFGVSFFLKDFIQKKFGTKFAIYNTIFAVILVGLLYVESAIVGHTGDYSFFLVLLVSSIVAIISETIDSFIFRAIFRRDPSKAVKSSLISNIVSVPIDSILFGTFALYFVLGLPVELVVSIAIGETIVKYLLSGILSPVLTKIKAGKVWLTQGKA